MQILLSKIQTPTNKRPNANKNSNFKKSYENAVRGNTKNIDPKVRHLRKPSKTNIQEEPPNLLRNLELLHLAHTKIGITTSP